jgi:acetyl-CoA carboxylase carboxyl transferase subunit beta|uniref:Acetyl-coenzyme A carboxylase carboxyl transferase subunit beta, chloroplastic n=1 Tax=Cyanidiaceae sp. MX-AZ01 TaxID=1503164 RepID=A0A060A984_9RHOD|nr:acetyl-CoA carboxylase beta subunit [Cyanidiaceae sp. MX-AZ01]
MGKSERKASPRLLNIWSKCEGCQSLLDITQLKSNLRVCMECDYHWRMPSRERITSLVEQWHPINEKIISSDALNFHDQQPYALRLKQTQHRTQLPEAVLTGIGRLEDQTVALGVMDFDFMGGSMGSAVGEKITRLIETSISKSLPLILISASGGARMQEGALSLMQMAKIASALERFHQNRLLYISVLTSPTTGGVMASFAMLGDLILAEPKATVGFAGKRVIEQTIKEELPKNFQSSEYLIQHGFLDLIVHRSQLKSTLYQLIRWHHRR